MSEQNNRPAPSPVVDSPSEWVRDHATRYEATDGADGHDWNGLPCLLVTTKGRRTGRWVRSVLIYGVDDVTGDVILVASKGGHPSNPLWFENMVSNASAVFVQIKGERYWATAREAVGDERERMWRTMNAIFPTYDEYREKAAPRVIPVVALARS